MKETEHGVIDPYVHEWSTERGTAIGIPRLPQIIRLTRGGSCINIGNSVQLCKVALRETVI